MLIGKWGLGRATICNVKHPIHVVVKEHEISKDFTKSRTLSFRDTQLLRNGPGILVSFSSFCALSSIDDHHYRQAIKYHAF